MVPLPPHSILSQFSQEEDDPRVVVPGFQMTMQIEEPSTAEYWFVEVISIY